MELSISKKANINYLAKIVNIREFHNHPNPEVNKLKCAYVDGFNIIVGIDSEPGKYVYFPTSSCINPQFLSFANLYRHGQLNSNPEQTGMFEDNGRVKAIKLRGCISEGFLLPVDTLLSWISSSTLLSVTDELVPDNKEFDSFTHGDKSFWICKKYVIHKQYGNGGTSKSDKNNRKLKRFDRLIDDQFRFHYETTLIKKVANAIQPTDLLHISSKIHGTSGVSAYVLTKKQIGIFKQIAQFVLTGEWKNWIPEYNYIYSSRTVIKNRYINKNVNGGYYGCDVWSEADKIVRPTLEKGMTAYYEIVGFLPNGRFIQKNYDYGCIPPTSDQYIPEKHFKVRIYRLTYTNVDGKVHEFSPEEVQTWCKTHGLTPVTELYYGYAGDLYPELKQECNGYDMYPDNWYDMFLETLSNDDENFYMEQDSPECNNKVPHEGIVLKIDNLRSAAYKLKCFAFLNKEQKELDAGESNIEDES